MTDAFEWSLGISLLFFYSSLTYEFSKIKSTKLSFTLDAVNEKDTVKNGDFVGRTSRESRFLIFIFKVFKEGQETSEFERNSFLYIFK